MDSSTLVLIDQSDVFIILYKTKPAEKFGHDFIFEVLDDTEFLELRMILNHVLFDLLHLIVLVVVHLDGYFIGIVIQVDEAVVQEEATVAFLAVAIVDLISSLDVINGLNDETSLLVCVGPTRLAGAFVVEHVRISHEPVSLDAFDLDTEDTTGDHHSNLRIFSQGELTVLWNFFANKVVVRLDVFDLFMNLVKERRALEPLLFLLGKENREVSEVLGENVNVRVPLRGGLSSLLHDEGAQERMLW